MENEELELERILDLVMQSIYDQELDTQRPEFYSPFFKSFHHKNRKIHKHKRKCIIPNCLNYSIKNSHAIPKSASLGNIAHNGILLQPDLDAFAKDLKVSIRKVGINKASTFPGFCNEHEAMFIGYENSKEFDNTSFVYLQTYRTLAREIVSKENEIVLYEKQNAAYKAVLEADALEFGKRIDPRLKKVKISGLDERLIFNDLLIKRETQSLHKLKVFADKLYREIISDQENSFLCFRGVEMDFQLPLSLSGFSNLYYKSEKGKEQMFVVMNVIPMKDRTYVFCSAELEHETIFNDFSDYSFQHGLSVINMIESFMIFGSDNWFISPKYWYTIDEIKRDIILQEILHSSKRFTEEYHISIFDDVRKLLIDAFNKNTAHRKLTDAESKYIEKESSKLLDVKPSARLSEKELIKKIITPYIKHD